MFQLDLKFGNKYEDLIFNYYNNRKYICESTKDKKCFKDYDLKVSKKDIIKTIEVKADRLAYKTGNIAIEFECNNKESGINSTLSTHYYYFIIKPNGYDVYKILTKKIKKLIENKKYFRIVSGGDNYSSKMYLFKLELFEKYKLDIII